MTALRKAVGAFRAGSSDLSEMFKVGAVGAVDDIAVAPDGGLHITATVTDPVSILKVGRGVFQGMAVAVRVVSRDPADPRTVSAGDIVGIALVDRPDDGFAKLAKAAGGTGAAAPVVAAVSAMENAVLNLSAQLRDMDVRLARYERPAQR